LSASRWVGPLFFESQMPTPLGAAFPPVLVTLVGKIICFSSLFFLKKTPLPPQETPFCPIFPPLTPFLLCPPLSSFSSFSHLVPLETIPPLSCLPPLVLLCHIGEFSAAGGFTCQPILRCFCNRFFCRPSVDGKYVFPAVTGGLS